MDGQKYEFRYPDPEIIQAYFTLFFLEYSLNTNSSKNALEQPAFKSSIAVSSLSLSPVTLQEYFLRCNGDLIIAIQITEAIVASR